MVEELLEKFEGLVDSGNPALVKLSGEIVVYPNDFELVGLVRRLIEIGVTKDVIPVLTESQLPIPPKSYSVSFTTVRRVYEFISKQRKSVSSSEIAKSLRLSKSSVRKALSVLVKSKKIVKVGMGPNTKYKLAPSTRSRKMDLTEFSK